ncbi:MAG TPA: EamA family transporter [Gemmataceae bacterium]|nr:EamA family transporter [Gemmataceae bacterium]
MNRPENAAIPHPPAPWSVALAFGLVYLSWGTTYLAIKKGVQVFPPALFGGSRIALAGCLLMAYLALRRQPLRMPVRDFLWTALVGVLLFVGGNGLITVGEKFVASGVASVLVATTPLWMALLEMLWPWGERLRGRGWVGLFIGLAGVLLLLAPRLQRPASLWEDAGPLLVLGSSFAWSIGSFILRYPRLRGPHLTVAAYQMLVGGLGLVLIGLLAGETGALELERITPVGIYAFFHLLVFGSLIGFVAYNWLLGHVSAALAGTYAYVNPLVAILVGWFMDQEPITGWILGGMVVILAGVALVRGGGSPRTPKATTLALEKTAPTQANGPIASQRVAARAADAPQGSEARGRKIRPAKGG